MSRHFPQRSRGALGAAVLVLGAAAWFVAGFRVSAEPVPGNDDRIVAQLVCEILQQGHVTAPKIDDEISRRLYRRFLKDLDPAKLYFQKNDIDAFKQHETELDDMLQKGDLSFMYKVYERFLERVGQRLKLIEELATATYDFTQKEYLNTDATQIDYAATEQEIQDRWRRRIKFDLLRERLGAKPLPEAEARTKVRDRYRGFARRMKQLDNYDLMEIYLSSLAASLDPHGAYMSPNTLDDFEISMRLRLEGIGAVLREENGHTIVVEIVPGGAASKDGRLKANDKIIAVAPDDGKFVDIVDMKLRDAVKLIRGPKGTKVELKVVPVDKLEPTVYALTRQQVEIKSQAARYEILEQGKNAGGKPYRIGVIDLPSFYAAAPGKQSGDVQSASKDVRRILVDLNKQGVDGVILDMRNNPGGFLGEAVALAGLFIDQGPVVQVKDPGTGVRRLDDPEKGVVYDGPLMVLVNRSSASASEIVAATLQDYGRALIVGDSSTHGKGTVQAVIDLGEQLQRARPAKLGALRLTMQQFYRVTGDSTQNRGVLSDVVVPSLSEFLATPEKDMEYALPFDRVRAADYRYAGTVPAELKTVLKTRSTERVAASKDFAKLAKDIERLRSLRERKKVPLSEQELKAQMSKEEAEQADQDKGDLPPEKKSEDPTYKFPRNYVSTEILKIMEDLLQGKNLLPAQGRLERRRLFDFADDVIRIARHQTELRAVDQKIEVFEHKGAD
jgi:carboxyl-terminal processing protease